MSEEVFLIKQVLIPCIDAPNINGRVYTMAAAESIVEQINADEHKRLVFTDVDASVQSNLERMAGFIQRAYIENNQVFVDIKLLSTAAGNLMCEILQHKQYSVRTACEVEYDGGVIKSPTYISAFFCNYQDN